jgi:uncharacterized membrane protein YccC
VPANGITTLTALRPELIAATRYAREARTELRTRRGHRLSTAESMHAVVTRRGPDAAAAHAAWRDMITLDRAAIAGGAAVAGSIGYALPLVAGLASGHTADGITASAGALIVGFANLGGAYRVRAATLLAATLATGAAALLGGLAGPSVAASVVLLGVWGFFGGLLVSAGRRAAFVGLLSTWALLFAGDLNLHGQAVLHEAWLITAGGLVQTVVAITAWPLRPYASERRALAGAYRTLAAYARNPDLDGLRAGAAALAAAGEVVRVAPAVHGPRAELGGLIETGEWVRVELASLARCHAPGVEDLLETAADVLDAVADDRDPSPSLAVLELRARAMTEPTARARAAAVVTWTTAAARETHRDLGRGPDGRRRPLTSLHAELTLRSAVFRHAARLTIALVAAALVYRGLSLASGYWIPLTVLFVLRPDYRGTVSREFGRVAGTMVGVTVAWVVVTAFSPSDHVIVVLLALLVAVAYALYPANYALFSIALTVVIALLAEFSGGSPVGALADRLVDTAIGGAIALAAFLLWPTPEAPRLHRRLADFVVAEGAWLDAILAAYSDPERRAILRDRRLATRRARLEARESVRRALAEPPSRRPDGARLAPLLDVLDQITESALVLAARVHDGERTSSPALPAYREAVRASFRDIATAVQQSSWNAPSLPAEQTRALGRVADAGAATVAGEAVFVLAALERLAHAWDD